MIASQALLTLLLLGFIAMRAFLAAGIVIALIGLLTRDRLISALALVTLLLGLATAVVLPPLIDPTLRALEAVPIATATALPFYAVFVALSGRIRHNPTLRWAFRIPVFAGAAGFVFTAAYMVSAAISGA